MNSNNDKNTIPDIAEDDSDLRKPKVPPKPPVPKKPEPPKKPVPPKRPRAPKRP